MTQQFNIEEYLDAINAGDLDKATKLIDKVALEQKAQLIEVSGGLESLNALKFGWHYNDTANLLTIKGSLRDLTIRTCSGNNRHFIVTTKSHHEPWKGKHATLQFKLSPLETTKYIKSFIQAQTNIIEPVL